MKFRALMSPTDAPHQARDRRQAQTHAELPGNDISDTLACPDIAEKAMSLGSLQQKLGKLLDLLTV